ncbi:metalloregulator ArsR/SmtB family transcription factor [Methylobacterium sp.]|jgi:ArsR family transcriptional regulator|uniref:ArsR/SmtB family transcription factor n=1 Tax=Methylobacterium sp. TaxID=409 RepID=UPI002636EA19|nr:metalloregulator ArsR/SmtB family transcription factor [Methylobacterium sp.]MDB5647356.1 transcriptional regulator, ArsR family [Methylobacterium sp.]
MTDAPQGIDGVLAIDEARAVAAFAALGQENRLRIVRVLVTAGPDGMAAGRLAGAVGVSGTNLSFHLKELSHAGLVRSRRAGRSILYSAAYPALSGLIQFLMRDCCQGRPEVCAPAVAALAACCPPTRDPSHA